MARKKITKGRIKKTFVLLFIICVSKNLTAQNVGIGNTAPAMKLHVTGTDSAVVLLENTQALNTNVKNVVQNTIGMLFNIV